MRARLVLAVLLVAVPGLASAERVKVAVVPGGAVNLEITRVDALSQDLGDALRAELDIDMIAGLDVRRRLPDAGLQPDCVVNEACLAEVARRLDAQQLLFVVMVDTGTTGGIQVDTTWVDVQRKRSAARPAIQIPSSGDARSRFTAAASQLLPEAKPRAKPAVGIGGMTAPAPRHFSLASYLTAGATLVGLGVGVGFGLRAGDQYDDCEARAPRGGQCSSDERDTLQRTALIADAGWLLAVGGTIATAVLYATSGESAHILVSPTQSGVSVSATGTF